MNPVGFTPYRVLRVFGVSLFSGSKAPFRHCFRDEGSAKTSKAPSKTFLRLQVRWSCLMASFLTWILSGWKLANLNKLNLKVEHVDTRMKLQFAFNFELLIWKCVTMIYKLFHYFCMCLRGKRNQQTRGLSVLCTMSRTFFLKWYKYSTRYSWAF